MMKKRGKNLDTSFADFWKPPETGCWSYRIRTMKLYDAEIEKSIKQLARYAFYKGWQSRSKRDAAIKRKKKQ